MKTNETKKPIELTDDQLENVNGGMKIVLTDYPKFLRPLLRLIFKIKEPENSVTNNTDAE